MSNLISNALKFTKSGGKIDIIFNVIKGNDLEQHYKLTDSTQTLDYIHLIVKDTGIGIPEDKLEKVFERYYQIDEGNGGNYNWGTGIGLYYAQCLVSLHHGAIKAENNPEGGTIFSFILPVNDQAYLPTERSNRTMEKEGEFKEIQLTESENNENSIQKTLLIVDDDPEIVHYIKTLLSPYYRILCRFDARSAFESIREEAPDLVLSDVVMPGINGYEFCQMIKQDIQLSHIPVILVTSKATVEEQIGGLNIGADAYVTKPFDPQYLLAIINSQLKNRENIRQLLGQTTQTPDIEQNLLSAQDSAFMTNLYRLMENELSNTELNITRMTEVLHISRTKFYYKVKGLTGENPNVFFKIYKLNRAVELLKLGKYNISEIADLTGFSTLAHFSTSFKKHFGTSPSEYYHGKERKAFRNH